MRGRRELPTGLVTFLFSDIEGSTRLLQRLAGRYPELLERHASLIRAALDEHGGVEVGTEGDSFFAVFRTPAAAVAAASRIQAALATARWSEGVAVRVRIGLHTGEGVLGVDGYVGIDVHRAARIANAAHGGQVLISRTVRDHVEERLPTGVSLRELGTHRLKDLDRPEHLWQLVIDGIPSEFAPPRAGLPGNVPEPATSLVGREREIGEVRDLLETARLVTLTGAGGAGKTRLAIAVAAGASLAWPDGSYFVALEAIREAGLVAPAIAQTIGVPEAPDVSTEEALAADLREHRVLLVLDNFEQVLEAGGVVDRLLAATPGTRALVTSRARLQLYGEQEYPVPPLAVPDVDRLPPADRLAEYGAVALFVARARAGNPRFAVTDENAAAVAQLCARLDGLPLAIELAAARVKLLPPEAILARLGKRLDLLLSIESNLPARQRTLRAAVAWSYDLLTDAQGRLLERLGAFAGGCTLEAASAVCDPDADLGLDLLDGLGALVDHSLVKQLQTSGEPRFALLETIREFALERLTERGEAAGIRRRHAEWVRRMVEEAEPLLELVGDDDRLAALEREYDNVRAALRWAIDTAEVELALRIAGSLWRFWQREGLMREGRSWVEEVLGLPGADERTVHRAKTISALGSLAWWQNDLDTTRSAYEEALAIYRGSTDERGLATAIYNLGYIPMLAGEHDRADALFAEAWERFRSLRDTSYVAESSFARGYNRLMAGDAATALPFLREALQHVRQDPRRLADHSTAVAQAERIQGNAPEALRLARQALELLKTARDAGLTVTAIEIVAACAADLGYAEPATVLFAAGAALRERYGGGPINLMLLGDTRERAEAVLDAAAGAAARARGAAMTLDEAVAYALRFDGDVPSPGSERRDSEVTYR